MTDIMGLMNKAKEFSKMMQETQEEIKKIEISASAGAGLVTLNLRGDNKITKLHIDPSLAKPDDIEILEDLIIAAYNEAYEKLQKEIKKFTEKKIDFPLPAGMNLPFL